MSCPWGKVVIPEPVNLQDIMSEEMAKDLQAKEVGKYAEHLNTSSETFEMPKEILEQVTENVCDSDAVIARMLQQQFDKEYDEMLKRTETKYNGTSKVSVSFDNYRRAPLNEDFDSESEEEELVDPKDRKDWDRFDTVNREFTSIPPCGYRMKDGKMVTKHDVTMNGRRNACKMLSFPPEFQTGDGAGFDLQLSNKVFNSLRAHSNHEQARRHKVKDKKEDHATAEFGIDEYTRLLLYKMINNQLLEKVNGVISIGKEAVILHADTDEAYKECPLPKECVIKVFKTTLSEFKQRDKYIKDDYRFKDRIGNQTTRKIIQLWAEKEMHNLTRLQKAGIPCPEVVALKHHVLVMSFIGKNHMPAPKLKDVNLSNADFIMAYNQVIEGMKSLYDNANLIHSDLSEYNILWHNEQCYFIDVSQAVEPRHENAFHFLMRDCTNVTNFFNRRGVPEVMTAEELFRSITGCDYGDKMTLLALQDTFKMKPHLVDKPGIESTYNFELAWAEAAAEKTEKLGQGVEEVSLEDTAKTTPHSIDRPGEESSYTFKLTCEGDAETKRGAAGNERVS